jgi:hypothetical protein
MLGIKAKLYYRSAGSYGSPTWTEIDNIADCTLNFTWDEGAADDRSDAAHRMVKTQFSLDVTGTVKKKIDYAPYEYLADLVISRAVGDFLVLDGPRTTEGHRGFRFDAQLFSATEDQGLAVGAIVGAIVLKPTDSPDDNPVKAAKVGSGPALTYATIGNDTVSFA